ncbi:MAG: hypothetical protein FWD17_06130 [Polyangiaceae bacterium]|nr:hypothetical protein [Polyangiaceae bacterium]
MQVTSATTSPYAGGGTELTADDLFAYCEAQTSSIDGEAQTFFTDAENNDKAQAAINQAMADVRTLQTKMSGGSFTGDEVTQLSDELKTLEQNYPAESSQIQSAIDTVNNGGDTKLTSDEAQRVLDTLSGVTQDFQSDNQMTMIKLQSAMSEREQAIQLTTNILQTLNDSETKVITNIHS